MEASEHAVCSCRKNYAKLKTSSQLRPAAGYTLQRLSPAANMLTDQAA